MSQVCSVEKLKTVLDFEPKTGVFTWKKRVPSDFSGERSPIHSCAQWNSKHAGKRALNSECRGYKYGRVFGVKVYAHRAIWAFTYGVWPAGEIDHINGCPSDNRVSNLRLADRSGNSSNVRSARGSSSKFLGVYWCPKDRYWIAAISKHGSKNTLGYFRDEKAAALAYDKAAREIHGSYANPNFPEVHDA